MRGKYLICIFCLSLIIGCVNSKKTAKDSSPSQNAVVPADFKIMLGTGGGFTGIWSGYTIYTDGTAERWEGRLAGENAVKSDKKIKDADLKEIWRFIEESAFFEMNLKGTGNITSFLEITKDGVSNRVSWASEFQPQSGTNRGQEELYRNVQQVIKRVLENE